MNQTPDVIRAYEIIARWQALAERRLSYLIELYQAGRWQRYYSETEFLTQIREVVTAVDAWRKLSLAPDAASKNIKAAHDVWKDLGGGNVALAPTPMNEVTDPVPAALAPLSEARQRLAAL